VPAIAYGGPDVPPEQPSEQSTKIAESLVLLEFVGDLYPNSTLLPKDPVLRAKARFFIDAVGTKLSPAWNAFLRRGESEDALLKAFDDIQSLLPKDKTFAVSNDFTTADAAIAPFLARIEVLLKNDIGSYKEGEGKRVFDVLQSPKYSKIKEYFEAIKARDSFKKTFDENLIKDTFAKRFTRA